MKLLAVASECVPLLKTGGLADVVGALPGALARLGVETRVLMPGYPGLAAQMQRSEPHVVALGAGKPAKVIAGQIGDLQVMLVDAPGFYGRPGGPYQDASGQDWPDNDSRFAHLARVGAAIAKRGVGGWAPDVVHAHDWQAGLVPVYLKHKEGGGPPVLVTIHNVAFQGLFPPDRLAKLGLPEAAMHIDGVEFHGQISFLKGGLACADRVSTVSPTYAQELTEPAFGMGFDGLLRHRAQEFCGILNGIDLDDWNPATDPAVAATFSAADMRGKAKNRIALAERFNLDASPDAPIFIVISRLSSQKGLDLAIGALPTLIERGACLAVLGSGETEIERAFEQAVLAYPGRVGVAASFDVPLSHRMQAGGDAILIPSRFEPCGLTQLYAQRYGVIPVVARTGGLADTVIDANHAGLAAGVATGVVHAPGSADALRHGIERTCDLFRRPDAWSRLRANAMALPVGWETSAATYKALYEDMQEARRGR